MRALMLGDGENGLSRFGSLTGTWSQPCEDGEAQVAAYRWAVSDVSVRYFSVGQTTRILDGSIDGPI